ncbi:hypothetical protein, partial [Bradyrhizobium sp.]|uniref:hypothetical protein n=1 Tax=Bradyrhizobium sp. TaxID=376 RepID=UPI004037EC5C
SVASGTSVALSTLFTGLTDPDSGDSVTHVWVSDRSAGGGHLTKNGVVQNDNLAYGPIPVSQLSQWAFLAGGTDTIAFQTVDSNGAFSATAFATVTVSGASTTIETAFPPVNFPFAGNASDDIFGFATDLAAGTVNQQPIGAAAFFIDSGVQTPNLHVLNDEMADDLLASSPANDSQSMIDGALGHLPAPGSDSTVQKVLATQFDQFLFH